MSRWLALVCTLLCGACASAHCPEDASMAPDAPSTDAAVLVGRGRIHFFWVMRASANAAVPCVPGAVNIGVSVFDEVGRLERTVLPACVEGGAMYDLGVHTAGRHLLAIRSPTMVFAGAELLGEDYCDAVGAPFNCVPLVVDVQPDTVSVVPVLSQCSPVVFDCP